MRGIQALFVRRDESGRSTEVGGLHYRSMGDGQHDAPAVSGELYGDR